MISYLTLFFIILFTGDETMFLFSFLSTQGYLNIFALFFIAILSNLCSDFFFFFFGDRVLRKWKRINKYKKRTENIFKKTKNQKLALFLSKFIYGTRSLTVIFLGGSSMKFLTFIIWDIIALIPITIAILFFGWFAGQGANYLHLYKPLLVIFPLIILIIFRKWVSKFVQSFLHTKKQKE